MDSLTGSEESSSAASWACPSSRPAHQKVLKCAYPTTWSVWQHRPRRLHLANTERGRGEGGGGGEKERSVNHSGFGRHSAYGKWNSRPFFSFYGFFNVFFFWINWIEVNFIIPRGENVHTIIFCSNVLYLISFISI